MNVDGKQMRPIWFDNESKTVKVIDQRRLPHELIVQDLTTNDLVIHAIKDMYVRGAPLIGATGALGVYVILVQKDNQGADDTWFKRECARLRDPCTPPLMQGLDIHVWVDETRPLNQGARLTAWELGKHGIAHTVITDNAGGHLMQHGMVDLVIVGTDRTTRTGDVANKIGTYLKALAAKDNNVPFYVALPSSTFDWTLRNGIADIPIETRDPHEITHIQGLDKNGDLTTVMVPPAHSPAANHAFDVTPARLVSGFITERGICEASEAGILSLFPERI